MTTETVSRLRAPGAALRPSSSSCPRRCCPSSTSCRRSSAAAAGGVGHVLRRPARRRPGCRCRCSSSVVVLRRTAAGCPWCRCRSPTVDCLLVRGRRRRARTPWRGRGRRPVSRICWALAASRRLVLPARPGTGRRRLPAVMPVPGAAERTCAGRVGHGHVGRVHALDAGGHQVGDRLDLLTGERGARGQVEQHRRGRLLLVGREDLVLGQGDVHDRGVDAVQRFSVLASSPSSARW